MDREQIQGIRDGYRAFREDGRIEVYADDGRWLFSLSGRLSAEEVNAMILAYG